MQPMKTLQESVIDKLQARKGKWGNLAREIGMSYITLRKVATRESPNPTINTLEKIAAHFRKK